MIECLLLNLVSFLLFVFLWFIECLRVENELNLFCVLCFEMTESVGVKCYAITHTKGYIFLYFVYFVFFGDTDRVSSGFLILVVWCVWEMTECLRVTCILVCVLSFFVENDRISSCEVSSIASCVFCCCCCLSVLWLIECLYVFLSFCVSCH
jgi:hypothetical protein